MYDMQLKPYVLTTAHRIFSAVTFCAGQSIFLYINHDKKKLKIQELSVQQVFIFSLFQNVMRA
jgi:hypothetical protein